MIRRLGIGDKEMPRGRLEVRVGEHEYQATCFLPRHVSSRTARRKELVLHLCWLKPQVAWGEIRRVRPA